jgi:hypothetical protein
MDSNWRSLLCATAKEPALSHALERRLGPSSSWQINRSPCQGKDLNALVRLERWSIGAMAFEQNRGQLVIAWKTTGSPTPS